jgi:hypothetical protein
MPTYEVRAPDGNLLEFEGPEGATQDELLAYAQRMYQPKQRAEDVGFIPGSVAAAKRGVESLGDVASGLGLAGTALTGTEAETRAKMQAIKSQQAIPETIPGMTAEGIQKLYQEKGLGAAAAQVPKYISENILQAAPQMAIPLTAGAAAAAVSGPLAPIVGPIVGMGTYGIQQFGNFLVRQAQEKNDPKELEIAKAATTAAITAPLGYYADRFTTGLTTLGTKKAGEEILKELTARELAAKVGKRVAVGAAEGVIAEAPVEVLEQAAERYQAGLDLTNDDAKREFKEAFYGAAAAGGGIGGATRGVQAYREGKAQPPVPTPEEPIVAPTEAAGVTQVPTSPSMDTEIMMAELEGREPRKTALTAEEPVAAPEVTPVTPVTAVTPEAPVAEAAPVTIPPAVTPEVTPAPVVEKPQTAELIGATSVPTPEINIGAAGQNNFAFMDKGEVKSIYGNIITKGGREYIQYKNEQNQPRQRLLTKDVVVNPTPDHMELLQLYKAREKADSIKDNFLPWLKKYGISTAEKADMGIEKSAKDLPVGLFKKEGYGLDELARAAVNDGILTESDLQDGVGGVESMRNLIYDTLYNQGADTTFNMNKRAELYGINQRIQELETALEPAPEEAVAEQAQETAAEKEAAAQFAAQYREGTVEEKAQADYHAQDVKGQVVYQKGNIALIRGYDASGRAVYAPTNGSIISNYDVDSYKGTRIPASEIAKLSNIKKKLEELDKKEHATSPFVKFNKDGLDFSSSITPQLKGVISDWKKLLNLKQNIYVATVEDVLRDKNKYTGPHRAIGSAVLKSTAAGSTRQMDDGSRYIVVKTDVSPTELLETIAHEMGHAHEKEVFNNAPQHIKEMLYEEHDKWKKSQKGKSAKELVDSMRARKSAKTSKYQDPMMASEKMTPYWRSFGEWYADQVSRWATTSDKPVTIVEKFFAKLGAAIKRFFAQAKNKGYLPNETFKSYMDGLATEAQTDLIADKLYKGQMALFSEREVTEQPAEVPTSPTVKVNKHRNIEGEIVSPVWNSPEMSKIDNFLYKLQDKHIDTKRVIQAIQKEAGQLEDNWNVYLKEELYHGRTSAALRKFLLQDLMPAIKQMSKLGISPDDMKAYLHNRHAKERNDQIAKIRPAFDKDGRPNPNAMTDKGSGLSYKQVDDYFSKLDPTKAKNLEEVAKEFDSMIQGTQKILVSSGAEPQSAIDSWNKAYKNYVPLFRADDDFATHPSQGTGAGFSSSGASSKRAIGSEKEVQDILGNIIAQRERALIKAEKIRVGRALFGLTLKSPNPDFWLPVNPDAIKDPTSLAYELDSLGLDGKDVVNLMEEVKRPEIYMDPQTGLETVRYKINPLERYKDNVFPVRINGKDRYIFFNQNDPRAKRMVEAMKNLDTEQLGDALGMIGKLTRWFAAVNTQYNPVFGGINLLRDVQGAAINLSTTKIAGEQRKVLAGVMPSMRTIFATLKAERNGQPIPDTKEARLWEEFKAAGAQTLYRDSLTRKAEEKQLVDHELNRMKRGPASRAFSATAQLLSDFNDTIENSVRFSAYKVAIEKGLSKEQAASIAKNLTVNFDRKGQLGSRINALYAFFNASVQGTARLAETIKGPAGRKIVAGGMALGAIQAIALAAAGFEEDEPPEFIKERNLIIPLPGSKYAMIPMPLGLHFFPNIGRKTTEFVLGGGKNPGKHTAELFGTAMDAFNPVGSTGLSMQTLLPTVVDPLAALEANKDAFGRPIYKADRATNPTPGYTRSRESASEISKLLSEFLNYASGGTEFKKGAVSPTADALDYLAGQFTGGAGREVMKVEQAIKSTVTGEELPSYRVPIAGRFIGDTESKAADAQRFYDNVTKMAEHENEIKGRRKPGYSGPSIAEYMSENPEARLWQQTNTAENQISQINKQKKEFQSRGFPPEKIQALEDRKQAIMKRLNTQIKNLQE